MKFLITGICGFVGNALAHALKEYDSSLELIGLDNLIRRGSEINRQGLEKIGVKVFHGDLRLASDLELLPKVDAVIDAAANPSVLAGADGKMSSRQLVEHNLSGTINLLEYCKQHQARFILLSTSRVYSISPLATLPVEVVDHAFCPSQNIEFPKGMTSSGINEAFSTKSPVSLYGATKRASEQLALEYGEMFGFPVFINRCGVLAGAGQFGKADQGIFSYWINSYLKKQPLKYIGFGGSGHQVRDCLHPNDLAALIIKQFKSDQLDIEDRLINCSGGINSAYSLRQLSDWCSKRFGWHDIISSDEERVFDLPWVVLDSTKAERLWNWNPTWHLEEILEEIASHAEAHSEWLKISS